MSTIKVNESISQKYAIYSNDFVKLALKEKKRQYQLERLEILAGYGVITIEKLEAGIENGSIPEHPGWEDLIEIKNIEAEIKEIKSDIESLSEA